MSLVDTATAPTPARAQRAGLARLVRAELRWIFRRPRNLVVLGLLAVVPIVMGLALTFSGGPSGEGGQGGPGASLLASAAGNALVLPIVALAMTLPWLLPLATTMTAGDALAGESSHGTLRGWLLAPVSRGRLLAVKATGVATVAIAAAALIAVVGVATGLVLNGSASLFTLSGSTLSLPAALGKVGIAAAWVALQLFAIGAVALAISASTEHPMVVVVSVLGGIIVFTVLGALDAVSWLHPFLLNATWQETIANVLRDPMPTGALAESALRAACYLAIGLSVAYARIVTKDG